MFEQKRGHIIDYSESTQKSKRSISKTSNTYRKNSLKSQCDTISENFGWGLKGGISDRISLINGKKGKTSKKNTLSSSMNDKIKQNLCGRNDMLRGNYSNSKYLFNDAKNFMESFSRNSVNSKVSDKSNTRYDGTPREMINPTSFVSPHKLIKPNLNKN